MSAFEIKVTPTRCKSKMNMESREPIEVVMAPFSDKSIVLFEDVPVTKKAKRVLRIINPSDDDIQVRVAKPINIDHNVTLEWLNKSVAAHCEVTMEMVWSPEMAIACKETMQLVDNRNFRKDIAVILKSRAIDQVKGVVRKFPSISSGNYAHVKTLRLKSPKNAANKVVNKSTQHQAQMQKKRLMARDAAFKRETVEKKKDQHNHWNSSIYVNNKKTTSTKLVKPPRVTLHNQISPLTERNIYCNNNRDAVVKLSPHAIKIESDDSKENISPLTVTNVLNLIDDLKFTPANLASLPTPSRSNANSLKLTPETPGNHVVELKPRCLTIDLLDVVHCTEDIENDIKDTTTVINNKTFDVKLSESLEISRESLFGSPDKNSNTCGVTINRTTVINTTPAARLLDIIQEEDNSSVILEVPSTRLKNDIEIIKSSEKDLKREIKIIGTPLRKYSESMLDLYEKCPKSKVLTQGSLPNLNEMDSIKCFEQNRYFTQTTSRTDVKSSAHILPVQYEKNGHIGEPSNQLNSGQTSLAFHADLNFNQNEILAQSSRFNLNEVGLKGHKTCPILTKTCATPTISKAAKRLQTVSESHKRELNVDSVVSLRTKSNFLTVSPPKRQKLDITPSMHNRRTPSTPRVKNRSQIQSKNYKLPKSLSLIKTSLTPRQIKDAPRIKLYEADLYLEPYINPDPFAATTTCDPFLASTMYLDEVSVDKHQADFKKWLNALVTIPADLDTDPNTKIDVGKLFNEVRHKDLILAPTKEEQSINYLTNFRLESLRRAAVELFLSEEMRIPCSKVAVYVQKNALRIRSDRNLHLDVVTQRDILELLLCFNPLWLRLGLEVIYGEKIHLHSNRDIVGISSFILNRLFRDKFLEQKYSKAYTLSAEYAENIKKFTLQKFFFLLLFLDKAKEKRIIAHNPCLFIKKSPYKETREILLRFSSELLANIGDVTRELKRLGYILTHKQTFLDEFDYAFHNLAVDLRDGIRLTRVMEIILLRNDLTRQLRVPAISRLQRIFNVNLALKALSETDFQLKGFITANDIVDGHREKTLSLLWQIIYKFRSPKFHAAAAIIQKWWRKCWLKVVIHRRIRHKEEHRLQAAATVIQSAYRGFVGRRYVSIYKKQRTEAVIVLQKYVRRYLSRKKLLKTIWSTLVIQKWFRSCRLKRECREKFLECRKSAICIQRYWRYRKQARLLREQVALENQAAIVIQAVWRGYKVKVQFLKTISAALILQRAFRARQLMKQKKEKFIQLKKHTIFIQRKFRAKLSGKKQKKMYELMRSKILCIQRWYRATTLMREQRNKFLNTRRKAVLIQQKWRATILARKVKVEYLAVQYYTLLVQQKFRAKKQMKIDRKEYLQLKTCVINVQQRFRAKLEMRSEYRIFQKKMQAIKTIQTYFRAYKAMRYQRAKYQGTKEAVLCLQQHFRSFLKMREERKKFLQLRQSAIIIQVAFRRHCVMKLKKAEFHRIKKSVACLQTRLRATLAMRVQRREYLRACDLIVFVQTHYKAKLLARKQRIAYLYQRTVIISIQRRFRAKLLMLKQRANYLHVRSSIIRLQRYYRLHVLSKQQQINYQQQRSAAIKIQIWFRGVQLMRRDKQTYHCLRSAIVKIQQRWKATLKAKNQKRIFLNTRNKVIYIQRLVRATLLMKIERAQYLKLKANTIIIQKYYRARLEMLQKRSQYQLLRYHVIAIQRLFRAKKEMKILKKTVIHLQQKFRGRIKMRLERKCFLKLKSNITEFQAHARGILARRRFQSLMTSEMRELLSQRRAAKIIQSFWRGYCVRKRLNNLCIKVIRRNIAVLKETSKAANSIKFKVQDAVGLLKGRFSASEALHVLMRLDRISRTVPHLLMCRSDFISTFCYGIMAQAIRSEVDKQLIMYCSRIILNLARYNSTTANTFQEGGLVTIAQMLLRWCDKDSEIFNTLCTLIWIFSHCPVKRKIIHDFMTTTDAIYMLRETKKLVARKEKMKQNVRKPVNSSTSFFSTSSSARSFSLQKQQHNQNFSSRALPSLEPDYGVIRNKPYIFISSVYAFDTILYKLGIDII